MKRVVLASLAIAVTVYGMWSFGTWEWNPGLWTIEQRGFAVTAWFIGSLVVVMIAAGVFDDDRRY